MSIPDSLQMAVGSWAGTKRLYLPGETTRETPSFATVALAAQKQFCTIAYTWTFDAAPQDGLLLIGQSSEQTTVMWIDSWHMGDKILHCQGPANNPNEIRVRGSYQVENSPEWGWSILVVPEPEALAITMHNIAPTGEEYLALEIAYTRTPDAR